MTDDDTDRAHTHSWQRDGGPCQCGEPVPVYLRAAWDRYAEKTAE